jgi:hypothetical protein
MFRLPRRRARFSGQCPFECGLLQGRYSYADGQAGSVLFAAFLRAPVITPDGVKGELISVRVNVAVICQGGRASAGRLR